MSNGRQSAEMERITFIENYVPPLHAGEYIVTVRQELRNLNPQRDDDRIDETHRDTRRFVVAGERFALDPTAVHTVYPPRNGNGDYSAVLPHIVFTRRTLPWERTAGESSDQTPWTALLVFYETDPPPVEVEIAVGDLGRSPFVRDPKKSSVPSPSELPATTVSYEDGFRALGLPYGLDPGEQAHAPCRAIDIPVELFSRIAPGAADLRALAHARRVGTEQKSDDFAPLHARRPDSDAEEDSGNGAGEPSAVFSVLVANRLSPAGGVCTVHLVSLEGMAAYLPTGEEYTPGSFTLPDGTTADHIRLLSLRSWSFTSTHRQRSFSDVLADLDVGPLRRQMSHDDATSGNNTAATTHVANAFAMGYTAADHQTRLGDRTVSWYRGPLLPFLPSESPDEPPPLYESIESADQAVRYNPETGLMDVSYGAAWQLGRMLALANSGFSLALYNWRQVNVRKTVSFASLQAAGNRLGVRLERPIQIMTDEIAPGLQSALSAVVASHGPENGEHPGPEEENDQ